MTIDYFDNNNYEIAIKFSDNPNYFVISMDDEQEVENRIDKHLYDGKDLVLSDVAEIISQEEFLKRF